MMILTTFKEIGGLTAIKFSNAQLSSMPCGLFRASVNQAYSVLPEMAELYDSIPLSSAEKSDWEIDVKIHMLMPGQFPCIPNWHCDNVPRNKNGMLQYDKIDLSLPPMLLWVSGTPCTEFLSREIDIGKTPRNHEDVAMIMNHLISEVADNDPFPILRRITPQQWVQFDQTTPHRGVVSTENQWRIFARVTHKSILTERAITSVIRRHCQVYLDARTFAW